MDLYSDKQSITVVEGKDTYELRFKIYSYNQDPIFVNYNLLIDCTQENNELVCPITRKQLDAILTKSESGLYICYTSYISEGERFPLIPKIDVIYEATQKTDVYVGITKLIEGVCESDTMIAYKTNVTDIDNVFTDLEDDFQLEFFDGTKTTEQNCVFRKYVDNPLLILCFVYNDGTNWLKEITQEKVYNNLNVKYNFRIQPVKNRDKINFTSSGRGSFIIWSYPQILNFTKNDTLYIYYSNESPRRFNGITFNENAEDLNCEILENKLKRCVVNPGSILVGNGKDRFSSVGRISFIFSIVAHALEGYEESDSQNIRNADDFVGLWEKIKQIELNEESFLKGDYIIEKECKYAIYGIGGSYKRIINDFDVNQIVLLCDSRKELWGKTFDGHVCVSPIDLFLRKSEFDKIFVASVYYHDIRKNLIELGFQNSEIVSNLSVFGGIVL